MKKLILLSLLLGLSGCGDNNQSDTSQSNSQATTLQETELTTQNASTFRLAAAPQTLGAVAPLAGWSVTNSTVVGASTLIDAIKDTRVSAALVTPNAKQVAEVLRGGAAGVALTIAVDQLLGAVDWVMDPVNNQIVYTVKPTEPTDPRVQYYYQIILGATPQKFLTGQGSCDALKSYYLSVNQKVDFEIRYDSASSACKFYGGEKNYNGNVGSIVIKKSNPLYDPNREPEKQTLPLEVVAEQVISNADAGSLDAQVATNIAVSNILNDVEQAEPVVQDLENNAQEKCDPNTNQNCRQECEPPAGVKFNKVTHFERHGRDPDINKGSHGCMAITGSPVHWHYSVNHQLPDGRCFLEKHAFGGCGVAP